MDSQVFILIIKNPDGRLRRTPHRIEYWEAALAAAQRLLRENRSKRLIIEIDWCLFVGSRVVADEQWYYGDATKEVIITEEERKQKDLSERKG